VISLLSQLGTDAKPVEPAIARALNDDDNLVSFVLSQVCRLSVLRQRQRRDGRSPSWSGACTIIGLDLQFPRAMTTFGRPMSDKREMGAAESIGPICRKNR
jgi:hypothetical protein